jgi:hypothetical protein
MLNADRADAQFNTSRRNMASQNLMMEGRNTLEEFNMLMFGDSNPIHRN